MIKVLGKLLIFLVSCVFCVGFSKCSYTSNFKEIEAVLINNDQLFSKYIIDSSELSLIKPNSAFYKFFYRNESSKIQLCIE